MKELMHQVLEETIAIYTDTEKRAEGPSGCVYHHPQTGNTCAVGRCLSDPEEFQSRIVDTLTGPTDWATITLKWPKSVELFKPEYAALSRLSEFWNDIQALHDSSGFWLHGYGLSAHGQRRADKIAQKINSGEYDA